MHPPPLHLNSEACKRDILFRQFIFPVQATLRVLTTGVTPFVKTLEMTCEDNTDNLAKKLLETDKTVATSFPAKQFITTQPPQTQNAQIIRHAFI